MRKCQEKSLNKCSDDPCPHKMCDGSGWIENSEDGHREKCLCKIEYENA